MARLLGEGESLRACRVPCLPPHSTPDTICDALHITQNHKPGRCVAQPLHRLAVEIMMLKTGAIFLDLFSNRFAFYVIVFAISTSE